MLRKTCGRTKDLVMGDWIKLHMRGALFGACHDMLSRRSRWVVHVACRGRKTHKRFWWESLEKRDNLEDLGVNGKTMSSIQMDRKEI